MDNFCMKMNGITKIVCAAAVALVLAGCSRKQNAEEAEKTTQSEETTEMSAEEIARQEAEAQAQKEAAERDAAITAFVDSLSFREAASQLFLVNLQGNEDFAPVEFEDGRAMIPGGYIFFSFNVASSPEKIIGFTDSIASYCEENALVPPYLSIDQEGGLVNRLRGITSSVPSCRTIAANYSEAEAAELYESQARQLSLLGFHLNLAPVTEAAVDENREFLGTRSYGDAETVKKYATIAVRAYQKNGIGTVLKHFPGNTNTDPHSGLPEIKATDELLSEMVVEPFRAVIQNGNPSAILMSHARTSAHDGDKPACFSHYWISDMLRGELAFQGLIFSDDIFMAALEKNGYPPEKAVILAIEAGVDCIMLSEKRFTSVLDVLEKKATEDSSFLARIKESARRVIRFKIESNILGVEKAETEMGETITKIVPVAHKNAQERLSAFVLEKQKGDSCVK